MSRRAERYHGKLIFHVVRQDDRYACGSVRHPEMVNEDVDAHDVAPARRCLRVGCSNDYAKADAEARRAAERADIDAVIAAERDLD